MVEIAINKNTDDSTVMTVQIYLNIDSAYAIINNNFGWDDNNFEDNYLYDSLSGQDNDIKSEEHQQYGTFINVDGYINDENNVTKKQYIFYTKA